MAVKEFAQQSLSEITNNHKDGASQLARRCLQLVAEYGQAIETTQPPTMEVFRAQLFIYIKKLQAARPSMVAIENLLQRLMVSLNNWPQDLAEAVDYVGEQVQVIIEESNHAVVESAVQMKALIQPGSVILTHSISSTIIEVFRQCLHFSVKAIITESRPGNEGVMLAKQLSDLEIPTQYITDAQMGLFIQQCDIALVGADTVLTDGSLVNKAGTYLLALAAADHHVPFYVCSESHKFSKKSLKDIGLEEKDSKELKPPQLTSVRARNIYFDVTPRSLITGYVTENGIDLVK